MIKILSRNLISTNVEKSPEADINIKLLNQAIPYSLCNMIGNRMPAAVSLSSVSLISYIIFCI